MRLPEISTSAIVFSFLFTVGASAYAVSRAPFMAGQTTGQSLSKSTRLRMVATAKKGETAHSLVLEWSLKNISAREVNFRDTHILRDYSIVITDREGHPLRATEKGQQIILASGWVSHRDSVTLHPREQIKKQIVISDIYDFKPGQIYTIRVERKISFDQGKTFEAVTSNIVRANVEE